MTIVLGRFGDMAVVAAFIYLARHVRSWQATTDQHRIHRRTK